MRTHIAFQIFATKLVAVNPALKMHCRPGRGGAYFFRAARIGAHSALEEKE
jgi:hypothetical protein